MANTSNPIVQINKARRALALATDIEVVLDMRDAAATMKKLLESRGAGLETQNEAADLKIRVERKLGEMLGPMLEEAGRSKGGRPSAKRLQDATVLKDYGIEKTQSHRWQVMGGMDEDVYEAFVTVAKERGEELTSRMIYREAKRLKAEKIGKIKVKPMAGEYAVAVIDPPWPMEKIERDVAPNQVAFDYPTMSEDELAVWGQDLPLAQDAHVWLWTTHKFLPMALRLLGEWRLKYVCTFTWCKPGGFQPFGLPQYSSEFAIYSRRGAPEFTTTKDFHTWFQAPRGKHSEKPEAFYDLVRRVTDKPRIDIFNRRKIEGFDVWGNEACQP